MLARALLKAASAGASMARTAALPLGNAMMARRASAAFTAFVSEHGELCPSNSRQPSTSYSSFSAPSVLPWGGA